jgi:hypothetical protein
MWNRGEGLKENRVLLDVKLESIGGPAAESLYAIIRPALTGEEDGSAGAKRMATERG